MAELNHLFSCPLCELSFLSVRAYVSHVRLVHFRDNNITLMCGINGCVTSFGSFAGFNSHVYRHHRDALELTGNLSSTMPPGPELLTSERELSAVAETIATCIQEESNTLEESTASIVSTATNIPSDAACDDIQKLSAKFILHLSQQHHLSQSAISDVIEGFQSILLLPSHL